jgi:hypothetical protein
MGRLDSRVLAFTFVGIGIVAACTTDGGGTSSGGTSSSSGGTSGSTSSGGTSGTGGGDGGGGGGGACRGTVGQACFDCCGETETTFVEAEDAFIECACIQTACTTECGAFCADPSAEPDEACGTCLESAAVIAACDPKYLEKCLSVPECKKVADCASSANCGDDDDDDGGP